MTKPTGFYVENTSSCVQVRSTLFSVPKPQKHSIVMTIVVASLPHGVPEMHFLHRALQDNGTLVHGQTSNQWSLPQALHMLQEHY
mgnify:CR=1 FL=1